MRHSLLLPLSKSNSVGCTWHLSHPRLCGSNSCCLPCPKSPSSDPVFVSLTENSESAQAVCISLRIKGPSTDTLSATLSPSSANSPLDSPVVVLRGLSLGRTSGASQTSHRSSAHSSIRSGKSGKIYRSFRYTVLTSLHSGSQKSSEQHSERHRTGQRASGWYIIKGEGTCHRHVTGPYCISVNVAKM